MIVSKGQEAVSDYLKGLGLSRFKLSCVEVNGKHTKFNIYDPAGANCGQITVNTKDVICLVRDTWRGNVDWNYKVNDLHFYLTEWGG